MHHGKNCASINSSEIFKFTAYFLQGYFNLSECIINVQLNSYLIIFTIISTDTFVQYFGKKADVTIYRSPVGIRVKATIYVKISK